MPRRYPARRKTRSKRKTRKKVRSHEWLVVGIIMALIVIVAYFSEPPLSVRKKQAQPYPQQSRVVPHSPPVTPPAPADTREKAKPYLQQSRAVPSPPLETPAPADTGEKQKEAPKKDRNRPEPSVRIAIVIDDLGQSMVPAQRLVALSAAITFSILPNLEHSEETAQLAEDNGRDVLLHMPMERKNLAGKGEEEGTLHSDMTPQEFTSAMEMHFNSVPGAIGINNHEGSALTENSEAMKFLMAELKARDLMFLDSFTAPKSIAYATAKEFGLKAAKRDVFLDNYQDQPGYIRGQLDKLARIAKKRGSAVGIGHPYGATLAELKAWLPEVQKQGIAIVPVSELMK